MYYLLWCCLTCKNNEKHCDVWHRTSGLVSSKHSPQLVSHVSELRCSLEGFNLNKTIQSHSTHFPRRLVCVLFKLTGIDGILLCNQQLGLCGNVVPSKVRRGLSHAEGGYIYNPQLRLDVDCCPSLLSFQQHSSKSYMREGIRSVTSYTFTVHVEQMM